MTESSDLPLTCNHWGTYRVKAKSGMITSLHGFEEDEDPSPIGYGASDVLYDPNRIIAPMVRRSWLESGPGSRNQARGAEAFVEVSWEDAECLVATELERVREKFGNESIFGGSYGWASAGRFHHAQSQLRRFLNCIGGFTRSLDTYSFAAAEVLIPHILGNFYKVLDESTCWPSILENTKLIVAFGGIPVSNSQINSGGLGSHSVRDKLDEANRRGINFVNITPIRSDLLDTVNGQWIPLRPGTDVALLLALAHTIHGENLHDAVFINRCTVGFDKFLSYVNGNLDGVEKSADWAAPICDLPAEEIIGLARRMARTRTMISVSWSLTRQDHGEQPYWAAVAVAAMLGQLGLPGGGIGFGYGAVNSIGEHYTIIPAKSFPQANNPVKSFIPVARISDMLLNPGQPFSYNGKQQNYPDIELIYWAGGNPFHHHQDLNRLVRAWRKPSTIIVHDWCWNSLAKHSDIVLPCTTPMERNDIVISRDPYIFYTGKAAEPPGQCRNDFEIFRGIARFMGKSEEFTADRDEEAWLELLYCETVRRMDARGIKLPAFSELKRKGWHRVEVPQEPRVFLSKFRENPERHRLRTPSGKIEISSERIGAFNYGDCPGHPAWMEPAEWLGSENRIYPLHLISNQPRTKLHAQLDHGPISRAGKINDREPIGLNPVDASKRGIRDRDVLRVFNRRGECLGAAVLDDRIRPGVVQMCTGAWYDPAVPGRPGSICKHGNPNVLTLDKGTSSLAQGPVAHTCLVEVELYQGEAPPVTAHQPPEIFRRKVVEADTARRSEIAG